MFRSNKEKNLMTMKNYSTITVFLTILLFIGLPMARAANQTATDITISKSQDTINEIGFNVNDTLPARPLLSIVKTINGSIIAPNLIQVQPNTTIRVDVTIKNVGNRTAYNLTTTDPGFEDWAIRSLNLTTQRFIKVGINSTIYYRYYFKSVIEGNFTIASTSIDYIGKEDDVITEYNARSQRFYIYSIKIENIAIIEGSLWVKILYYTLGISAALGSIIFIDYLILRRKKDTTKKVTKREQAVKAPKSKKQQKRKIQKRR
jgi:hypothetical protein